MASCHCLAVKDLKTLYASHLSQALPGKTEQLAHQAKYLAVCENALAIVRPECSISEAGSWCSVATPRSKKQSECVNAVTLGGQTAVAPACVVSVSAAHLTSLKLEFVGISILLANCSAGFKFAWPPGSGQTRVC